MADREAGMTRVKAKLRKGKHDGRVDITRWDLPSVDAYTTALAAAAEAVQEATEGYRDAVMTAASEVVKYAAEEEVSLWFSNVLGVKKRDFLSIDIYLPLGDDCNEPCWTVSLRDLVKGMDPGDPETSRAISAGLRQLADLVDAELAEELADYP